MIEFCLNSVECDPDAEIKSTELEEEVNGENNDNDEDEDEDMDEDDDDDQSNARRLPATTTTTTVVDKTAVKLYQRSIFLLLRTVEMGDVKSTHPLEYLLEKTKDLNVLHPTSQRTPLLEAIHLEEVATAKFLINHSMCHINLATSIQKEEKQQTPLIVACKVRLLPIIRALVEHPDCDLLAQDEKKKQALHHYLQTSQRPKEYLEILDFLLKRIQGVHPDLGTIQDEHDMTPLHVAVSSHSGAIDSHTHVEQRLIQFHDDLMTKDDHGNLPLHLIFTNKPSGLDPVELCALLLKSMKYKGIDTKNNDGNTPLHLAVVSFRKGKKTFRNEKDSHRSLGSKCNGLCDDLTKISREFISSK